MPAGTMSLPRAAAARESAAAACALDERSINVIRGLAMDAVERAQSGHPGMPMGAAAMAYVLWTRHLRHNPADPGWPDRDRFVLSAGHGSMLLYALLHLTGYDLPLRELRRFRRWGSCTPGHPERGVTPGVETTTGPLGQGFGNAVGMAIAERWLAASFNRAGHPIVDHWTYVLASDGDLMEGVQAEAASLAGHLGLGRLIVLYDANGITIDGPTALAFGEDVARRYQAYGWHVQEVDGHELAAVDAALAAARSEEQRPSLVVARTHIGFGSPNRQDRAAAHGAPLGRDEVRLAKRQLGLPQYEEFWIPGDVRAHMRRALECGRVWQRAWEESLAAYAAACPELAESYVRALSGELPDGWDAGLPRFEPGQAIATRKAAGAALNALAGRVPFLLGGSADLAESTVTEIRGAGAFRREDRAGRNIHFGVREHAMGAILNGMALHGGVRVFGGTFLIFSDYMRPAIRLAALMGLPVTFVFTHDSIGLGEDGPTHQPVEQLMSLRLIPNLWVIRPADANEAVEAWRLALRRTTGPTALVLTRQPVPVLEREAGSGRLAAAGPGRGGYVLAEAERDGAAGAVGGDAVSAAGAAVAGAAGAVGMSAARAAVAVGARRAGTGGARGATGAPDVILLASGSEVAPCLEARRMLAGEGIAARVVAMPCLGLFRSQPQAYQEEVLPPDTRARIAVEAGAVTGWEHYVGPEGEIIGLDRFGASAPGERLFEEFGFSPAAIADRARRLAAALNGHPCS